MNLNGLNCSDVSSIRNPPNFTILDYWDFENFILADEPFCKRFTNPWNLVPVKSNLCRKLVSSLESPIAFDGRFKVTSVPFSIPVVKLWIREFYI